MNRALVPGVRGVDVGALEVVSWSRDPRFRRKKLEQLEQPDPKIAEAVRASLAVHPRTAHAEIDVRVENGKAVS